MTVSDLVAQFFKEKGLIHAFTVSGAGNIRLLDAISRLGYTELICCHHEQACAQAAIGYYRASGRVSPCIVTCGGGASNVVTGIVDAWMDSIPLFVIAGQEAIRNEKLRAYGVQGLNLSAMVQDVTKFSLPILFVCAHFNPTYMSLDGLWEEMLSGRPGPVLIEIPTDVQGQQC